MDQLERMAAAVQVLMRAIVDHPEQLIVAVRAADSENIRFNVTLSPYDLGKIIGMQGRTARAFRTILVSAAGQMKLRITLNIGDEHPRDF